MNPENVQKQVEKWLTSVVIDLNLCPFAQREYRQNKIRFKVSGAESENNVVDDLVSELVLLTKHNDIETSLLILPSAFAEFRFFNDFLGFADDLLCEMHLDGVYQIASFHPDYQFAGTQANDAENHTNRSPYPILHLLREASLEQAIARHPNTDQIPNDNIALMNTLGNKHMTSLMNDCLTLND